MGLWAKKYRYSVRNIAMMCVAAVALSSATYAWFVNNTKVTAETVAVTAKAAQTLLISETGAANWKTTLPLTDNLTQMVPVSTVGSSGAALTFVKDNAWTMDNSNNKDYASGFEAATAGTDYYICFIPCISCINCNGATNKVNISILTE